MNNTSSYAYKYFPKDRYVVRRKAGLFNGVPSDTALEQISNRGVTERASGLTQLTMDAKGRTKWLYTQTHVRCVHCAL